MAKKIVDTTKLFKAVAKALPEARALSIREQQVLHVLKAIYESGHRIVPK